jgi:hypothetical protein
MGSGLRNRRPKNFSQPIMPGIQSMPHSEEISVPRKHSLRLLQVLIILVAFFLVRNCIFTLGSDIPSEVLQRQYFEMGYKAGMTKALGSYPAAEPTFSDPLLKKKYRDGFRNGWDDGRNIK